ncbi:MAG TPA: DEAD/DEAH box helicase [Euryarchaeota archaeon]|nr:DEAD-box ATP-dependent RNA helicase CshA [archaeon BMS3Bbin15]HDL16178.1 DEAD/DEAH box helicase [Euryarchaeota archaeon]
MKFDDLNLTEEVKKAIDEMGFEDLKYIQEKVLPHALEGKDVMGHAPTGSGKTLGFTIPIAENVNHGKGVEALVICPTRELTLQVTKVIKDTCKYSNIKTLPVYGGVAIGPQISALKRSDVVVGTPGRLLDHIRRGTLRLDRVKILVLDEADRMLDMGFINDIRHIVSMTSKRRQTMFFSATIPESIIRFSKRFMNQPVHIKLDGNEDKPKINQSYIEVSNKQKFQLLLALIERDDPESAIIFCNTKIESDLVANNLIKNEIDALAIHGDLSQAKRDMVMGKFRKGGVKFLVATDVASRGLDIPIVSHIYNYDIPDDPDDYLHRIGRTARAGREGKAVCILSPSDHNNMRNLHKKYSKLEQEEFEFDLSKYPQMNRSLKSRYSSRRPSYSNRGKGGYSKKGFKPHNQSRKTKRPPRN